MHKYFGIDPSTMKCVFKYKSHDWHQLESTNTIIVNKISMMTVQMLDTVDQILQGTKTLSLAFLPAASCSKLKYSHNKSMIVLYGRYFKSSY